MTNTGVLSTWIWPRLLSKHLIKLLTAQPQLLVYLASLPLDWDCISETHKCTHCLDLHKFRDTTAVLHLSITVDAFPLELSWTFPNYLENSKCFMGECQTNFVWWLDFVCNPVWFNKPYNRIVHVKLHSQSTIPLPADIHCSLCIIISFFALGSSDA